MASKMIGIFCLGTIAFLFMLLLTITPDAHCGIDLKKMREEAAKKVKTTGRMSTAQAAAHSYGSSGARYKNTLQKGWKPKLSSVNEMMTRSNAARW